MDDTFSDIMSESIETFIDLDDRLAPLFEQKILSTVSSYDNTNEIENRVEIMEDFCLYVENMASIVQESNKDVDDLEKNLDKFINGDENILFIIGNAGSGKSTLAKYYAGDEEKGTKGILPNCIDVELDRLYDTIITKGVKKLPDTKAFKIFDGWEKFLTDDAKFEDVFRKAFAMGRRAAERDKDNKYIFTGIQTQNLYNANYLGSYPIIIKGTGKKTSKERKLGRIQRDFEEADSGTTKLDAATVAAGKQLKYMSKKGSIGEKVGDKLEKLPKSSSKTRAKVNLALRDTSQNLTKNKVNGTIRSNDKRMDELRSTLDKQSKTNPEYGKLKKLGVERGGEEVDEKTGEKKVPKYIQDKLEAEKSKDKKTAEERKAEREKAVKREEERLSKAAKQVRDRAKNIDTDRLKKNLGEIKSTIKDGVKKDSTDEKNNEKVEKKDEKSDTSQKKESDKDKKDSNEKKE